MKLTNYLQFMAIGVFIFTFVQKNSVSQILVDIDGNSYSTVVIGDQEWMSENLKVTRLSDGTDLNYVNENNAWSNLELPGYYWYNNDSTMYKNTNGAYYNWYAVNTNKLCPSNWHIPTDNDWKELEIFLGMLPEQADSTFWRGKDEGIMLKSVSGWNNDGNGNNTTGFNAKPMGYRFSDGLISSIGDYASWWSSTQINNELAFNRELNDADAYIGRVESEKNNGFTVRCIKD